ncbi:MAG TPA: hypothetical protein VFO69_11460 [Allosphingosinicella sp.]|nr:hypothetical protein [Allosphingosinicella sp.]
MKTMGQAGMLAAILLAPGCGAEKQGTTPTPMEPLRRATFRSLAARDFLASCPGGAARAQTVSQVRRLEELKQLAVRKEAGRAIWLGENDWAGVARYSDREPCETGEESYREALAAFSATLDDLAGRIADYRE